MSRLPEVKVMRDVIHGYIHVDDSLLWDLINAPEFQRLRRIRQLGGDYQVYHTAEHSRFSHSLGVYEIARRILNEVDGVKETLDDLQQDALLCAALLHDIGHGPFSHFFESISKVSHEDVSCQIVLDPSTRVHQILAARDERLPEMTAGILRHDGKLPLCEDLISSQLDCDRMDYLLRDAYESGTSYGSFDLERILRTLRVEKGRLCIKKSGIHSVEDYIMARYQMYWQVYLHPDAFGYELLITQFFKRYEDIRDQYPVPALEKIYVHPMALADFLRLDDWRLMTIFSDMQDHPDPVLSDLAGRIVNRGLFAWHLQPVEPEAVQKAGYDPRYYFHEYKTGMDEYLPYVEKGSRPVLVLDGSQLIPLSEASVIAKALLKVKNRPGRRFYCPRDVQADSQG